MQWSLVYKLRSPIFPFTKGLIWVLAWSVVWGATRGHAGGKMAPLFPDTTVLVSRGPKIPTPLLKVFLSRWLILPTVETILRAPGTVLPRVVRRGATVVFLCPDRRSLILPVGRVPILRQSPLVLSSSPAGLSSHSWRRHPLFSRVSQLAVSVVPAIYVWVVPLFVRKPTSSSSAFFVKGNFPLTIRVLSLPTERVRHEVAVTSTAEMARLEIIVR